MNIIFFINIKLYPIGFLIILLVFIPLYNDLIFKFNNSIRNNRNTFQIE